MTSVNVLSSSLFTEILQRNEDYFLAHALHDFMVLYKHAPKKSTCHQCQSISQMTMCLFFLRRFVLSSITDKTFTSLNYMSSTVTVFLEAGIAYPSRTYGFIPVFCWGHVDHIFFNTAHQCSLLNNHPTTCTSL
jgi:fucose permease